MAAAPGPPTLWCRYLDDPDVVPPRVAFAIGRAVGGASIRNRLRRRLRELVRPPSRGEPPLPRRAASC